MNSGPGYQALRRGRFSLPESRYFLTLTTEDRRTGLNSPIVADHLKREIGEMDTDRSWHVHGATIMPDHVHLLATLGPRLTLGQAVGRLKAKTRATLLGSCLRWQDNFFDRHLRPDDCTEEILRYIALNPYRSGLESPSNEYPWTWFGSEEQNWFLTLTDDGRPFPEWLR